MAPMSAYTFNLNMRHKYEIPMPSKFFDIIFFMRLNEIQSLVI